MASSILVYLLLFSLLSLSYSIPSSSLLDAAEILSDTGFASMAVSLELASQTLSQETRSLTIFAPSEASFQQTAQIPLSLLEYHLLPHAFSSQSLKSLPYGAKISTLLPGHSLIVTTSNLYQRMTINNVTVNDSPIFDDGALVIFTIEKFFDPYFRISGKSRYPSSNLGCVLLKRNDAIQFSEAYSFDKVCGTLRSKGCSVMASLLDMQFLGLGERPVLTLFAPIDEAMYKYTGNLSDYSSIFRSHLVPCKIPWSDLVNFDDGTVIWTYAKGFTINVTRSDEMLLLNDVPVVFPDLYYSDWLVVHGIREVLAAPKETEQPAQLSSQVPMATARVSESSMEYGNNFEEDDPIAHYHFSVFQ
ncbi:Fasciclin-like arabinogalactan protein [Quillaja saponaria]|uniref:Fasciclin-like arabinogalactan protein n=1 Tax=Quillaja saponaria TaxID=32244 RepID=A0AAD7L9S3_QUISA|nr:Fasciclin-like arabinogalactan protein [Quillaja saponaria]